ncbi:unnamed protein product [Closterium sp. Naga37s-1]|nr:unnamed protein product [Closterium sp. Naga37s-1]CAI5530287.1 unnamed protein product [Closterium sp. Naga37s-1]
MAGISSSTMIRPGGEATVHAATPSRTSVAFASPPRDPLRQPFKMMRLCLPSAFLRLADEHDLENQAVPVTSPERFVDPSHSLPLNDDLSCPQGAKFPGLAAAAPLKDTLSSSRDACDLLTAAAAEQNAAERNATGWADRASLEAGRASLDAQQGMSRLPPRPGGSGRVSLEESCCGRSYRCDNMCFRGLEAFPGEPTRRSDAASPRHSALKKPLERKPSGSIPRVMSDFDPISSRHSDPAGVQSNVGG